jgi:2-C-methyl-D-erythritol 2,4-cyclodiphosphate synthase
MRVGIGYDVHRLVEGRKLIIGGLQIPHDKGLLGHSDGDVILHAIADALLGAAALGDLGRHFPDTDEKLKGISSLIILKRVGEMVKEHKFKIVNVDVTLVLQAPKIAPYVTEMRLNIAHVLGVQIDQVSVKATTAEGMGFIGTGDGAVAYAVTSLYPIPQ